MMGTEENKDAQIQNSEQTAGVETQESNRSGNGNQNHILANTQGAKKAPQEKCPNCNESVCADAKECPNCRYSFRQQMREGFSRQQIWYGAPGTGKSNDIKTLIDDDSSLKEDIDYIRTTFHPASDYSTFVGCYKPKMETQGKVMIERPALGADYQEFPVYKSGGKSVGQAREERIVYKFVQQAFLKAYVKAWRKYFEENDDKRFYLIIEEINRGNCAEIFGDIFQLLDRNQEGFSTYPITTDEDIAEELRKEFEELRTKLAKKTAFEQNVLDGSTMCLPPNLYIWCTMNTSDQSLFPIDSAFKRRWDWKYMKIKKPKEKDFKIRLEDGTCYDWWDFLQKINECIYKVTRSEDKQLGYFFCNPSGGIIDEDMFVNKVLFYLWNDVFKDAGSNNNPFKKKVEEKAADEKDIEKGMRFADFF